MSVPEGDFDGCANRLKQIAHPERLHILAYLLERSASGDELANLLGVELATVEAHLQLLCDAGVVLRGESAVYSLNTEVSLAWLGLGEEGVIDFGCCRLKLTQIQPPEAPGE